MLKQLVTIFIVSSFLICDCASFVNAQSKLNSPYSYSGLGRLNDNGNVSNLALGGLGAALRNKREINSLNPASITSLVVTTYDAGLSYTSLNVSENGLSNKSNSGALEYVSLTFPLQKVGGATGIGLRRLNNIGYAITENSYVDSLGAIEYLYEGEGGINRLYVTQAFTFKGVSIGANLNFLFGSMKHDQTLSFDSLPGISSSIYEKTYFVKDLSYDLGLQYHHTFILDTLDKDKKIDLTIGATYEPAFLLAGENLQTRYLRNSYFKETLPDTIGLSTGNITMPAKFSAGISVGLNGKWLFGFDYRSAEWSTFSNPLFDVSGNYQLTNSNKMIFGVGFTPTPKISSKVWERTSYRLGLSTGKSQIMNNGQDLVNYGISFGLAIPLRNFSNIVGLSYEYGQLATLGDLELLKETYSKVTLSFTFNEKWFVKYKYD